MIKLVSDTQRKKNIEKEYQTLLVSELILATMNKDKKSKQIKSTFKQYIESLTPKQRTEFDLEYIELLLSELRLAAQTKDEIAVEQIANAASKNYKDLLIESLKDPKEAIGYLNAILEDYKYDDEESQRLLLAALEDIAASFTSK